MRTQHIINLNILSTTEQSYFINPVIRVAYQYGILYSYIHVNYHYRDT